jgi:hypothetical protein
VRCSSQIENLSSIVKHDERLPPIDTRTYTETINGGLEISRAHGFRPTEALYPRMVQYWKCTKPLSYKSQYEKERKLVAGQMQSASRWRRSFVLSLWANAYHQSQSICAVHSKVKPTVIYI